MSQNSTNKNIGPHGTHLSPESGKMGPIPNFNLPPVTSCPKGVPCARKYILKSGKESKGPICYAMRDYLRYRGVREAWDANLEMCKAGRYGDIVADVTWYVDQRKARYFRWFMGGDIPSQDFLYEVMVPAAEARPDVVFMSFTKNYGVLPLDRSVLPDNLHIILSVWKEYRPSDALTTAYPCEYYNDGTPECGIPDGTIPCGGHCSDCVLCFKLGAGEGVYINKH